MRSLIRRRLVLAVVLVLTVGCFAEQPGPRWRNATAGELAAVLPARAQVEKEHIETEMRTASGIIDSRGEVIAGVVLITAGYSADGKYSHFFLVQSPIVIGEKLLAPGAYVLGWNRMENGLLVHFYNAATGAEIVSVMAHSSPPGTRVEAFRVWPPVDRSTLQIGRFELAYSLR